MKKEIKVVAIVLVALIVFLSGYGLGASNGIKIEIGGTVEVNGGAVNAGATQTPQTTVPTTQAPQTTVPTTQAPAGDDTTEAPSNDTTEAPAPEGGSTKVPSGNEEIAAAYNKAINDYKAFTGNVTSKKTETIGIKVVDLPGIVAAIVNPVVEKFTGTTENTYTFTNGVDAEGKKTADRIIPGGRDANVQAAGIAEASATANADGGYTMKIKFVAESSKFDGTQNTSEPTYHMGAMDPLNLGTLDIKPITITAAELNYPGATVEATVDGQGRLVKLVQLLPLNGFGTGKAGIQATINLEGSMDATWEMTYA